MAPIVIKVETVFQLAASHKRGVVQQKTQFNKTQHIKSPRNNKSSTLYSSEYRLQFPQIAQVFVYVRGNRTHTDTRWSGEGGRLMKIYLEVF